MLFIILIAPIIWTIVDQLNKYATANLKYAHIVSSAIIFTSLLSAIVLPLIILYNHNIYAILPIHKIGLLSIGIMSVLASILYMEAAIKDEANVTTPLFQLAPIIGVCLGVFILKDVFTLNHIIVSIVLMISSGVLLLYFKKERSNVQLKVILLMLCSSLFYVLYQVLYKVLASDVTFWVSVYWEYVGFFISGLLLLLLKKYRTAFLSVFRSHHKSHIQVIALAVGVSVAGNIATLFAVLIAPISLVLFMNSYQPFFSLLIGILFIRSVSIKKNNILPKILYTAVMIVLVIYANFFSQSKTYYSRHEAMIPMRDGVRLFTVYYTPDKINEAAPFLISRTPYGSKYSPAPYKNDFLKDMARDGYIFVMQDVRGRNKSEGQFIMNGPVLDKPGAIDESTDAYDAIEWLLKNVPHNNGKAGIVGSSYIGWTTLVAAARPHPALVAASEQACMGDLFLGDDFHHNGAFRLSFAVNYIFFMENMGKYFDFDDTDSYSWFLKLGPLSNVNKKYFHGQYNTWNLFMEHPNYDSFWQFKSPLKYASQSRIPMLHVGGLWDEEDMLGPQLMYSVQEKSDSANRNYICLGPWSHSQWQHSVATHVGNYNTKSNTADYFQINIQKKWFGYWLKGKGGGNFTEATVFQTGSNQWKKYDSWPPKKSIINKLYLTKNGMVSFEQPIATGNVYDEYISDPHSPVPFCQRPIKGIYSPGSTWETWLTDDQRFLNSRPDVLSWQSDPLKDSIVVTGEVLAHIMASTSGTDADWVVKLIDVYPGNNREDTTMNGYELMIAAEIFRGRYRSSFETPTPLIPDKVEEYTIDMHGINHVFKKGHHLMIQIQSSWFPLYDMNPQKYVPSIYDADSSDYVKATQRIFRSKDFSTYIELPVVGNTPKL